MTRTSPPKQTAARVSRQATQAQTRAKLLDTAMRLFVEKGFGGTSIRDIAEQSGYTQGAFYSNFDSKEAVLLELLQAHMQAEAQELGTMLSGAQRSAAETLDELEAWAAKIDQDVNWSMLSIELQLQAQRSALFAAAYQAVWLQHREALANCIAQLFSACRVQAPMAVVDIASAMMALAHGLSLQRAATASGAGSHTLIIWLRGLIALGQPMAAAGTLPASSL